MRIAVGVFDALEAGWVIEELQRMGVPREGMTVVAHEPSLLCPHGPADIGAHIDGLHLKQTRDLGRVFVTGPLEDVLTGPDLFAALLSCGLSASEAQRYADDAMHGGAILAVQIDEARIDDVLRVMRGHAQRHPAPRLTDALATADALLRAALEALPEAREGGATDRESSGVRLVRPKPN